MREIKFRAWDGEKITSPSIPRSEREDWDYILMQYTGFEDKNEKELYEGDIIRISNMRDAANDWAPCAHKDYIAEIEWKYSCWYVGFGNFHNWNLGQLDKCKVKQVEIIGNIYENPELLRYKK